MLQLARHMLLQYKHSPVLPSTSSLTLYATSSFCYILQALSLLTVPLVVPTLAALRQDILSTAVSYRYK